MSDSFASKAATTGMVTLAGAVAGTAAGLNTMIVGPLGAVVGALIGAELAGVGSEAIVTEVAAYGPEHEEHYRGLWEAEPGHPAAATFESARPAYQFGHVAAYEPAFVGRDFIAAETDLRALWERDFRPHGEWEHVRRYACDAYGHSRSANFGLRRDASVIGTGGSAVDPLELARAQAGLASKPDTPEGDDPLFPTDLADTAYDAAGPFGDRLGEGLEVPASRIYPDDADVR
jgi:hypothetical protein